MPKTNGETALASSIRSPMKGDLSKLSKYQTKWQRMGRFLAVPQHVSEFMIPIDLTELWKRHLVWAKKDGKDLLTIVTARFTSTTTFLSLLVSGQLSVMFSPSDVVTQVRAALRNDLVTTLPFWFGIVLIVSIFFSISALLCNFIAWSIFVALSPENAAIILRSSIGLYAAQLPSRLVMASIYLYYVWLVLFCWMIMPTAASILLTVGGTALLFHIASTFSAMGRIIMATSAMGHTPIVPKEEEERLTPTELSILLLNETAHAVEENVPVNRQYRKNKITTRPHQVVDSYEESVKRRNPDLEREAIEEILEDDFAT